MVDIMDMEDIFYKVLRNSLIKKTPARLIAIKIREEVADFVEAQQTIECNNCKGKKFKNVKEPWQAM